VLEQAYPILEFDPARQAVIEPRGPRATPRSRLPRHAVLCFFQDVIDALVARHEARVVATVTSEIMAHPVYELTVDGQPLVVLHPGVGAPLAAGMLEETIARGCDTFVACGGAGVLDSAIAAGHVVVPVAAVRDEGTSYHYLPPSREVEADPTVVAAIERVLRAHDVDYLPAKTWTTDAFYRETPGKVRRRREEGCLVVEMEAAAFFAVARFRGVRFGQLLYGGDDVGGAEWDARSWNTHSVRETLFWLAAEACLSL